MADTDAVPTTSGPLKVDPDHSRYFTDSSGKAILLTGSHTWLDLQDAGIGLTPIPFNYSLFLDVLESHNHNFFHLWSWEQSRWTLETQYDEYWFNPSGPFLRTGPGTALDGEPKFDLAQFNQAYFDRMRNRVQAAKDRGIYVSIMLFNGWSVAKQKYGVSSPHNPWQGHPFNVQNNINGVNGDTNGDDSGEETHELGDPVLSYQEAYVKKVIDTVGDLDNVLYLISSDSHPESIAWQEHLVDLIHQYELTRTIQHPVGMMIPVGITNASQIYTGPEDWVIPNGNITSPSVSDPRKVTVFDTDHLCGLCYQKTTGPDDLNFGQNFVWKSFLYGYNPVYMDGFDGTSYGVGGDGYNYNEPRWVTIRENMGYALEFSRRMNFKAMNPNTTIANTPWVLSTDVLSDTDEFLIYQPDGANIVIDLSNTPGQVSAEWLNPSTGAHINGAAVTGGAAITFTAPFSGNAVLYLKEAASVIGSPTPNTATPTQVTVTPKPTILPATPVPTDTKVPTNTKTPLPTKTPTITKTATITKTPKNTSTPVPTKPTNTATSTATPTATTTPNTGGQGTATATPTTVSGATNHTIYLPLVAR